MVRSPSKRSPVREGATLTAEKRFPPEPSLNGAVKAGFMNLTGRTLREVCWFITKDTKRSGFKPPQAFVSSCLPAWGRSARARSRTLRVLGVLLGVLRDEPTSPNHASALGKTVK